MHPENGIAGPAELLAAHPALVAWLHAQSKAGRWGVSRERMAAALQRSAAHRYAGAAPTTEILETYLRGLHLEDLALACALLDGSNEAWEYFLAAYRPVLRAAARAVVGGGAGGDARACELADSLFADLYGVDRVGAERKALLEYFHGRSKLSTWLRAVLSQRHVDALRAARRTESLDDERGADARPAIPDGAAAGVMGGTTGGGDPDRARLLPHLQRAVTEVFAALPASDRLLLSLYYLEDLTLAQIAAARAVHEATISRQLDRIRRELREGVERALAAGRPAQNGAAGLAGLSPAEVQLCFSYAIEDWPFDLGRTLAQKDARPAAAAKERQI